MDLADLPFLKKGDIVRLVNFTAHQHVVDEILPVNYQCASRHILVHHMNWPSESVEIHLCDIAEKL